MLAIGAKWSSPFGPSEFRTFAAVSRQVQTARQAREGLTAAVGDDRGWIARGEEPVPEFEANETIRSEESFDPDLWVIEVMGSFSAIARLLKPLG